MDVRVIGNEVWANGYLVALLTEGASATAMSDFTDALDERHFLDEEEIVFLAEPILKEYGKQIVDIPEEDNYSEGDEDEPSDYCCALEDLFRATAPLAKGGYIKLTDLNALIAQLKEDEENE